MNNNNNKFSLRPLTDNDADSLARQLNNKKVWDNLRDALPYPYTSQDAAWFINFQQNDPLLTCYGIVVDGEAVGNIGFTRSEDITYDTSRSGINNIRVYYDEKNPRKIKFDGNGDRN